MFMFACIFAQILRFPYIVVLYSPSFSSLSPVESTATSSFLSLGRSNFSSCPSITSIRHQNVLEFGIGKFRNAHTSPIKCSSCRYPRWNRHLILNPAWTMEFGYSYLLPLFSLYLICCSSFLKSKSSFFKKSVKTCPLLPNCLLYIFQFLSSLYILVAKSKCTSWVFMAHDGLGIVEDQDLLDTAVFRVP